MDKSSNKCMTESIDENRDKSRTELRTTNVTFVSELPAIPEVTLFNSYDS